METLEVETPKNLELWESVEKTDPKFTKQVSFGRKYTAIDAQYQIREATKQFGPYGKWGLKDLTYEKVFIADDILLELKATFFYPDGEFELCNSTFLLTKGRVDTDAYKKIETDTLTKALSKLGFNADIFMGMYENLDYVNEMMGTFEMISGEQRAELSKMIQTADVDMKKFNESFGIDNLASLPIKEFQKAKAMLQTKINAKKKNDTTPKKD